VRERRKECLGRECERRERREREREREKGRVKVVVKDAKIFKI